MSGLCPCWSVSHVPPMSGLRPLTWSFVHLALRLPVSLTSPSWAAVQPGGCAPDPDTSLFPPVRCDWRRTAPGAPWRPRRQGWTHSGLSPGRTPREPCSAGECRTLRSCPKGASHLRPSHETLLVSSGAPGGTRLLSSRCPSFCSLFILMSPCAWATGSWLLWVLFLTLST